MSAVTRASTLHPPSLWDAELVAARVVDTRLRVRLRLNAAFSLGSAAVAAVAASQVASILGLDGAWPIRAVAGGLGVYSLALLWGASRANPALVAWGRVAAVADAAWVLGSIVWMVSGPLPGRGAVLLAVMAVPVGSLAVAQWRAARSAAVEGELAGRAPALEAVRIEVTSELEAARLWSAVDDHALFGSLASNLRDVVIVSGTGEG